MTTDLPAPDQPARPATAEEMNRSANSLVAALSPGWTHKALFAVGPTWKTSIRRPTASERQAAEEAGEKAKGTRTTALVQVPTLRLSLEHAESGCAAVVTWGMSAGPECWVWTICTESMCINAGAQHPTNLPVRVSFTELKVLVGANAPEPEKFEWKSKSEESA